MNQLHNKNNNNNNTLQVTEPTQKPPNMSKCVFTEGGVKCGERTLPSAKHCRKHILKVYLYYVLEAII